MRCLGMESVDRTAEPSMADTPERPRWGGVDCDP